jgi:phage gpG-like protein
MNIRGEIKGDREVVADLRRFNAAARGEIQKGIGRVALKLLTRVKAQKLTGQALNVRTGRLRRSITQRIEASADEISGIVGTNVDYAAVHEYGFKGTVSVKQHLRLVKEAFGRPLKYPVWSTVRAHSANVNMPERSFLRSALADLKGSGAIEAEMNTAVARAIEVTR